VSTCAHLREIADIVPYPNQSGAGGNGVLSPAIPIRVCSHQDVVDFTVLFLRAAVDYY
jgi:hypothetical protein